MGQAKSKKRVAKRFVVHLKFAEDIDASVKKIQEQLSSQMSLTMSKTQTYEYLLNKGIAEHQKQSQELCHNC